MLKNTRKKAGNSRHWTCLRNKIH